MTKILSAITLAALFIGATASAADIDSAIRQMKPLSGESADSARAKCARLSDDARRRGTKILIIGFDGLASFSASSTFGAYRYQYQLSHRLPTQRPGGAMTGFVVNGLLVPLIDRFKGAIEVLSFSWSDQSSASGSKAEICALEWMRVPGRKLIVTGHSFGGDAAVQLMDNLEARNVMVDLALTLDPVPKTGHFSNAIHTTRNARSWVNFYQRSILPMGVSLQGARINQRLSSSHVGVPFQAPVVNTASAAITHLMAR